MTRPGSPCSPTAGWPRRRRPGKLVNLEKELVGPAAAERHHRHRAHPVGHPRRADRRQRPSAPGQRRAASPSSTTASSRTSPRCAPSSTDRGHELASETDTEVVAHLLAEDFSVRAATSPRRCGRCAGGWRARSRWSRCTPTSRTWSSGARRNSPLVVGRRRGRDLPASDVAAFIAHTREAIELGQDQVVELRRDGVTVTDFDGAPAEVRAYHVDWDASAAEKGGYDYFMLKEIAEQPKAVADTLLGRIDAAGSLVLDEVRIPDAGAARGRQGRHRGVRHGVPRGHDRQVRHRALDPDPVRGRSWPASSATATRSSTSARW